nr:hypothetical protein [Raoultella planticola]
MADAARDGLRHEGLDLEVVLRARCRGQAGRDVNGACGVAPAESERHRGLAVGLLQSCISRVPACCRSARSSSAGSVLPRHEARRRIPAHAVALKKYLGGIDATSTTCHKKHATAPLGDAEILSIEHAPGDAAPGSRHTTCVRPFLPWRFERTAFSSQCSQEVPEGVAAVAEDAGDAFPDERCRRAAVLVAGLVDGICKLHIGKGQGTTWVVQPLARAGHAERLARRAADQDVGRWHGAGADLAGDRGHVAQVRHAGVTVGEHGARERLDLGEPRGFEVERLPGEAHGLDAAADAAVEQRRVARRCAKIRVHVGLLFVWRRAIALAGALKGRRKAPKAPGAFGSGGKKNHPWADWQARSSLEPSAHQAITPGPCRGWGRHRLAHIRAQRAPVFAPAGTGTEYR